MDPLSQPWQIFLDWFENISLLVVLILLYNYIPDRFFIHRDWRYSVCIGIIFTFAAIMGIFIPWGGTSHPSIGINGVLVPLAGMVGGPVSAVIITGMLLITRIPHSTGADMPDILIIIIAGIIGSLFYLFRERGVIRLDPTIENFLLSSIFAIICAIILVFIPLTGNPPGASPDMITVPVLEIAVIIFLGLFLLGFIIRAIDRKRDSEYELIAYKEHLEALVQERTAALERINSLQDATIESTTDGIFVTGLHGEIKGFNSAGGSFFGMAGLTEGLDGLPDINTLIRNLVLNPENNLRFQEKFAVYPHEPVKADLKFHDGSTYELSINPHRLGGEIIGHVYNFRNITKRIFAEEAIKNANQKLLLLSGITRHDILNQIMALDLYLHLVMEEMENLPIAVHLEKMEQIIQTMQLHIEFTRDYQDVGLHQPIWQNPSTVFMKSAESFNDKGILFSSGFIEYEIYVDPLLERVYYNLIDNSIRHGDHVTSISLSAHRYGDDLILVYTDNGIGVPMEDKDKIFMKGYGKHTGLGMFLIREILSITGLSIRENGTYGEGVRFEIIVPSGKKKKINMSES